MAASKKKTRKRTVVRRGPGAKVRAAAKRRLRAEVQKRIDPRLEAAVRRTLELGAEGRTPDEIAARVKAELAGLATDVVDDVLALVGPESLVKIDGD